MAEWFRYFAGAADKIDGTVVQDASPDFFVYTRREPIGVVAAILPWNAPLLLMTWKLAPALAAGCTLLPSRRNSRRLRRSRLAECFAEAGFPAGVFNVVTSSSRDVPAALTQHEGVNKSPSPARLQQA